MRKPLSTFSIVLILVLAAWQYFQQGANNAPSAPSSGHKVYQQANSQSNVKQAAAQSAVKNSEVLGDYDVVMREDPLGQNITATVDYYMLALSWSPAFCAEQRQKFGNDLPTSAQYQCDFQQFGWVVHGLWPQNENARSIKDHPRFCQGDLPALSPERITPYLNISPGAKLLQGEWEKHGACAFSSADAYFAKQKSLFSALNLPKQALSRKELFRWVKQHNPQLKNAYLKASRDELFICYDLNWQIRDCPAN